MINLTCKTCGANNFKEDKYKYVCQYCNATIIKPIYYSKKKSIIIVLMLVVIFLTIFIGYKLLYSIKSDIKHLDTTQRTVQVKAGEEIKEVYYLSAYHHSSRIESSKNKIKLMKAFLLNGKRVKSKQLEELGTFISRPDEYYIKYTYLDRPVNGYDRYKFYRDTPYSGLNQRSMYASDSMSKLILRIKIASKKGECKKIPSNTHNSNLNRDDNYWTNFCPKAGIITHLETVEKFIYL